ncbi:MAG: hypothetical protein ACKOPE_13955 [Novosphingobium sp.]
MDMDAIIAANAPPETPMGAIEIAPKLESFFRKFDPVGTASILAGLQTFPNHQANYRLEWAARLALASGSGTGLPNPPQLRTLLNDLLEKSRVNRLEDPLEDVMVSAIPTARGDFRLLTGLWEKAAHHTESVLRAFERLPDGDQKHVALERAYALLRISDLICQRSNLAANAMGVSNPRKPIPLTGAGLLSIAKARIEFEWEELAALGVSSELLAPFVLPPSRFSDLLERALGDSDLEFRPFVQTEAGIAVIAPTNLSTAIRGQLIDTVIIGGQEDTLRRKLLLVHSEIIETGSFTRMVGPIADFGQGGFCREHIERLCSGRYVHAIQVIDGFGAWPRNAFCADNNVGNNAFGDALVEAIARAQIEIESKEDFVAGVSFVFLSGWGSGHSFSLPRNNALSRWQIIFMEPEDAMFVGVCEDGKIDDIWRMDKQRAIVAAEGFEFHNANGLLNLFEWWRTTNRMFVPEHVLEAQPPTRIFFDTNLLLEVRREAVEALGRHCLPTPSGNPLLVMRLDPRSHFSGRQPVFASMEAAKNGILIAAVESELGIVWVQLMTDRDDPNAFDAHETWSALLAWAGRLLDPFLRQHDIRLTRPVYIRFVVGFEAERDLREMTDAEIVETVSVGWDHVSGCIGLFAAPAWHVALQRKENFAEAVLAANFLSGVASATGTAISPAELIGFAVKEIGSPFARWRHSFLAERPIDMLKALGLVPRFRAIPQSAAALVKTGLGWLSQSRSDGHLIEGKAECREFLDDQHDRLLRSLLAGVAQYNRESLVGACLSAIQAAQGEGRGWQETALALQSIHGQQEDFDVSFDQGGKANAVIRASSMLVELAVAESSASEGKSVGYFDFDELQAHAALLFKNADTIPAMEGGWIKATIKIAPTGDVLLDRSFEEQSLQKTAEIRHQGERNAKAGSQESSGDNASILPDSSGALDAAIAAEFGVDADLFFGLANALATIAESVKAGVFSMRRSELVMALNGQDEQLRDVAPLIDRYTMPCRNGWEAILPGATARDNDLAKFDRRFSLIGRPIVAIDDGSDPLLMVAPGVVERAVFHNIGGALSGGLQNEFWSSKEMQKFASRRGDETGLAFNDELARDLKAIGLEAHASAKLTWCLNHQGTDEVKRLGDIDVLVISPDRTRVWVIEAKDLKLCRTLGETARRLSEYQGKLKTNGKPDNLMKHLTRVDYVRKHAADLQKRFGLPNKPSVSGMVVVGSPQPMEMIAIPGGKDAVTLRRDDLASVSWNGE